MDKANYKNFICQDERAMSCCFAAEIDRILYPGKCYCAILNDTNFNGRPCPFHKELKNEKNDSE